MSLYVRYPANQGSTIVLSVGTFDSQVADANGAVIASNSLYFQSASASVPGMVNLGVQTFAGNKTFTGSIAASNFSGASSGTNTGDVSLAAVGSSPNANGASLAGQVLSLQPADGSNPGLLTAIAQVIGGAKTFSSSISASNFSGSSSGANTGDVSIGSANGLSLVGQALSLALSSGSTTGALSSADWTTFNSKQAAGNYITALTGDASATGPGSVALTLATVNGNVGSWGSATAVGVFTVNGKGLITAASNTPIQITESQVTNLVSDLAGKQATGNYITALTGDVVATGPGSVASTIQNNVVSNAKLAQMAAHTFKGNNTGSTANALDLTQAQLTAELNQFTNVLQGVVPGSGGGTTNFLRADGTWAVPASSAPTAPVVTSRLSGSGTHTFTGSPLYVRITMVGGGGGGAGSGTAGGGAGSNGSATTFGTSLLSAGGGLGGSFNGSGGAGGSSSLGSGPVGLALSGGGGNSAATTSSGAVGGGGGVGGASAFGGAGYGGSPNNVAGGAGAVNTGGGGGGAGSGGATSAAGGGGGGSGGFVQAIISGATLAALSGSAAYAVGAGGAGGGAGTSGSAGGAAADGSMLIEEFYQ